MKKIILFILILVIVSGCMNNRDPRYNKTYFSNMTAEQTKEAYQRYADQIEITTPTQQTSTKSIKSKTLSIASWYIDDMNVIKIKRSEDYYISVIKTYDIIIIQGITDDVAFNNMMSLAVDRNYKITKKLNNGEMHAIIYHNLSVKNISYINNTASAMFSFIKNNITLDIISLNTNQSNIQIDISNIEKNLTKTKYNTIIAGNLNTGCERYKTKTNLLNWTWIIPSNISTRSDGSGCSDDNIIINQQLKQNLLNYRIMEDVNTLQSKHYLVSATFNESAVF